MIEDNVNIFKCPLCKRTNCITCQVIIIKVKTILIVKIIIKSIPIIKTILQAVHDGMDCKQYQQYVLADSQDENSKKTREWIEVLSS